MENNATEVNEYIEKKSAENRKHQKAQRAFPAIEHIAIGDRFTVLSGKGCWSSAIEADIVLPGNAKVEVVGYASSDSIDVESTFMIMKLVQDNNKNWVRDEKLGQLEAEYTALANWHYRNEK